MYQFILMIHVFAAICVVALVLVQQGKGSAMGAAFGSGASSTVFGSRGSGSFLFRFTLGLIGVFFITSLGLNYLAVKATKQPQVITLPAQQPVKTEAPAAAVTPEQIPAASTAVKPAAAKKSEKKH